MTKQSGKSDPKKKLGGVFSGGVPPDSIPNSEVKPACGDDSAEVARCQNSTMPPFTLQYPDPVASLPGRGFLFAHEELDRENRYRLLLGSVGGDQVVCLEGELVITLPAPVDS
jgi:hypothetical protein